MRSKYRVRAVKTVPYSIDWLRYCFAQCVCTAKTTCLQWLPGSSAWCVAPGATACGTNVAGAITGKRSRRCGTRPGSGLRWARRSSARPGSRGTCRRARWPPRPRSARATRWRPAGARWPRWSRSCWRSGWPKRCRRTAVTGSGWSAATGCPTSARTRNRRSGTASWCVTRWGSTCTRTRGRATYSCWIGATSSSPICCSSSICRPHTAGTGTAVPTTPLARYRGTSAVGHPPSGIIRRGTACFVAVVSTVRTTDPVHDGWDVLHRSGHSSSIVCPENDFDVIVKRNLRVFYRFSLCLSITIIYCWLKKNKKINGWKIKSSPSTYIDCMILKFIIF